ncbi:TPA: hypothetical protein ACGTMT_003928 [Salmonella enterica]
MTTITNKKQYPSEQYLNELITNMEFAAMAPVEVVRVMAAELQERRKAESEPAGYHVIKECGKIGCSVATLEEAEKTRDFWNKKWTIRPYFYSAPPVQETGVYKDMLNIIGLLENNEWAEHCTSTVLGSLLESEITRLVGKEQPVPIVPPAIEPDYEVIKSILPTANPDEYACTIAADMWNACRADMFQGSQPVSNRDELSSPVIPDGYALVPVEPTPEMREAFHVANEEYESGSYDVWKPDHQWQAMLAAAPQLKIALASIERCQAGFDAKHALFEVAIARFSKMNEGFPIKRFKADWVISWMLENFPPVAQKQGDN